MQPKPISETLRPLVPNCRLFIADLIILRSDAVTARPGSLWLRHNQKIRTPLETLSSKSTKSTLNPCLQTRANRAGVKWQTIGIRSAVQCPLRVCAVTRRRFPVGASPTRQTLQPEAAGAVMEETKWLKPSISVSRIGDSASVQ